MKKLSLQVFSATTALALLAGATGIAFVAPLAFAAPPEVTTQAATAITVSDATLNALNGDTDATGTAFWVSTSTFTPVGGASPILPTDVYSTGDIGAVASSTTFSALLSSATIPAGLLPITAGTTYYFTAWSQVGGVWYPGSVLSFATLPDAPTVTGITPTSGTTTGGTAVTITGTNLTGATSVMFGATPATGVVVNSATSVTAVSPATTTAGVVDVTVTTTGGTSATSSASQYTYTAVAIPPATPVISNITVTGLASTTATVNWTTDIAADGQVVYGTTTSYGSASALNATASTTHSITLTGLSEGTTYHFKIHSNNGTATASSSDQTFLTQSTASSTPLAVTGVDTVNASATANNNFADGWKWVMHVTVPDNEDAFRIRFSDWAMSSTTSFPANGNIRLSTPQSSNASTTDSGIIATGNGYSGWFYLTGDASATTPGRQINLTIEVKIPVGTPNGSYSTTYTAQSWAQTATSTATI